MQYSISLCMFFQNSTCITVVSHSDNCQYLSKILLHEILFSTMGFHQETKDKYLTIKYLCINYDTFIFCQMRCSLTVAVKLLGSF